MKMYKKWILGLLAGLSAVSLLAQTADSRQSQARYQERYNLLVSSVGVDGVGVETLLDKWARDYPEDPDMLQARFLLNLARSRTVTVETRDQARWLDQQPLFSLKDSLGNDVRYFQVARYDDTLFGVAVQSIDRAIQLYPERLDLRLAKITALMDYEQESPDMAVQELKSLIDYNTLQHPAWKYGAEDAGADLFDASVQEYCYTFFKYATPAGYQAFRDLSEKMLSCEPGNILFMDNMGSYYLVAEKNNKMALKYYNKVLKAKPDDMTAIRNCILLARNAKDVKLEKKYLPMMVRYAATDADRISAQARLDALNGKKK